MVGGFTIPNVDLLQQENAREYFEDGVKTGLAAARTIYLVDFINEDFPTNIVRIIQALYNVIPGRNLDEHKRVTRDLINKFLDAISAPPAWREMALNAGVDAGLECDYCDAKLPWGYDSWRCPMCPMYFDVCAECREQKCLKQGEALCMLHKDNDYRNDMETFIEFNRLWECIRIILRASESGTTTSVEAVHS